MSDHSADPVLVSSPSEGVVVLTLHNPPLNLVTLELTARLLAVLEDVGGRADVRVVVLTGSGEKAFCAGSDIREFGDVRDEVVRLKLADENELMHRIEELPQPVIAALNGVTLGGGSEIALACDLRILADDARIGQPEVRLGVIPGSGGLFRLARLVGKARAAEIALFGRVLEPAEALEMGLVNRIVPKARVLEEALSWARQLAAGPQAAIRGMKRLLRETAGLDSRSAAQRTYDVSDQVFRSEDLTEGIAAFLEKRPPRFQ